MLFNLMNVNVTSPSGKIAEDEFYFRDPLSAELELRETKSSLGHFTKWVNKVTTQAFIDHI